MRPMMAGPAPGLQTSPAAGTVWTVPPLQSPEKTFSMADTATGFRSTTTKSRVPGSSRAVRLPVMMAETSPSTVKVF